MAGMPLRALAIVAVGCLLGAAVNAVSPRGISWTRPLGDGLRAKAAAAGLLPIGLAAAQGLQGKALFLDARPLERGQVNATGLPRQHRNRLHRLAERCVVASRPQFFLNNSHDTCSSAEK